eukprot:16498-Heterococcus_DN1.PRE.1
MATHIHTKTVTLKRFWPATAATVGMHQGGVPADAVALQPSYQDALDFATSASEDDYMHGHYMDATGTAAAAAAPIVQPLHARVLAFEC